MFSRAFHRKFVPLTEEDEIFGSYNDTYDHHPDSEADIVSISSADVGIMPYRQSNDYDTYLKRTESVASFSSIASARVRQQFAQALTNLHQSLFGMDSPVSEDRSPNQPHPPTSIGGDPFNSFGAAHHGAFDNGNVDGDHHHQDHQQQHHHDLHHEQQRPHATSVGMASSHGSSHESEDSNNGFVKLDHPTDLLADYGFPSDAHGGPHPPAPTFHRDEQPDFAHLHHDRPEITPSDEVSPLSAEDMDDMMASPPAHLQGSVNDAFDNQHKDDPFLTQTGQEITEVADKVHDKAERLVEEIFDAPRDKHPDVPGALPEHRKETDFPTEDHIFDNIDPVSPSGDSGRDVIGEMMTSGDDSPMGGGGDFRGVSPDERTYERDGPLTFGHHQTTNAADAVDDFVQQHHPVADPFSTSGFGSEPHQPHLPTENVRHPVGEPFIDLGPPSHPTHVSPPSTPTVKTTVTTTVKKTYGEGSGPWFDFKSVDSRVLDLIYWRDPRKSAVVLVATLALLICLATFSLVTVVSYAGLTLLAVTLSFRVYKTVLAQIQKTDAANPFQPYLEKDLTLPQERVHQQVDVLLEHAQQVVRQLRRLFLVEDIVDTVKFGLLLWALTYVGACFSGLTLVVLAVLGVFTIPKFYDVYKEPIDKNLAVVKGHVDNTTQLVQDKLPFLKKQKVQ